MNEMTPLEAAERLEEIAFASDLPNTQHTRTCRVSILPEDSEALKQSALVLRRVDAGELRPVIHAHWHENWKLTDGRINRDCSACHGRTNDFTPTPICPWCGALMDESDMRQTQGGKDDSHETD